MQALCPKPSCQGWFDAEKAASMSEHCPPAPESQMEAAPRGHALGAKEVPQQRCHPTGVGGWLTVQGKRPQDSEQENFQRTRLSGGFSWGWQGTNRLPGFSQLKCSPQSWTSHRWPDKESPNRELPGPACMPSDLRRSGLVGSTWNEILTPAFTWVPKGVTPVKRGSWAASLGQASTVRKRHLSRWA